MVRKHKWDNHKITYRFAIFLLILISGVLWGCDVAKTVLDLIQQPGIVSEGNQTVPELVIRQREEVIPYSAIKMGPDGDPTPPILHMDGWQNPVPLPGIVNSAGAEDSPFITPDGSTLYFFFTPVATISPEKQLFDGVTGIYVAKLRDGSWGQVERVLLQSSNKLALDGCPFVQADTIWFCSAREDFSGIQIFTAQNMDGQWNNWKSVTNQFGTDYEVGELHITKDGRDLYYHSSRPGGQGEFDIWVTRLENNIWQQPENVSVVNSVETDGWPFVSQDGKELWFTRTFQGSPAVFRSVREGDLWQAPELVVSQFAGEPTLDGSGNLYFVHHFVQDGIILEADIYVAYRH